MSKNVIHNFNLSIQNSADIKSSEHLTETVIKELAKVSKEMSQQKDIVQLWQEQNLTNTVAETIKNSTASFSTIPSILEGMKNSTASTTTPIEGGVSDNTGRITINSSGSTDITPSMQGVDNSGNRSQIYAEILAKQNLGVPQNFQTNSNEISVEVIKAEIKKKLSDAVKANDTEAIKYWTNISKAFDEGATAKDFDDKPGNELFTQMYTVLKQLNSTTITSQSFNWESIRKKMIESIDTNILNGKISSESKKRWETIKEQLGNDKTNIANLFERYDELFLLLKEVEGLDNLPASITIITKTKIYPNLSADKLYAEIGKEAIYGRLKQIIETNFDGSAVNKGAVKIQNTKQTSFIIGESLEFFVDETFINQRENQKENINWIVYNTNTKKEHIFKNEGTSFSYNFDMSGTYRIDAYGKSHTVKQKKDAKTATFIELKIIAQEIVITPPENAAGEFIRPFAEEKNFKISLKHTTVKTLNPLKLYYQFESITANKITKTSDEQELDTSGIIKLSMPDLGVYKIKVFSKDQYALVKEFKTSVIKNEVTRIGVKDAPNKNVFLLGDSSSTLTLEVKSYKINPPTEKEKEDVKWMIYDSNNKPYIPHGEVIDNEDKDSKKPFIHKWNFFPVPIPQKNGSYTIEAYYDAKKGPKSGVAYKIEVKQPEVTEACWAWSGGSKKVTSGFSGESNYIKAEIPHYENQTVRIYFYLNKAKTNHYIDVKTNAKGEIFEEVKFNASFEKAIGFKREKNAKVGFKLLGIQNSKPYPFNTPANYELDTVLSVTTDTKILDVYFTYDGVRVNPLTLVPYGAKVKGIVKTLNMVGNEVVLKVRRKNAQHSQLKMKTIVKSEGEASITFVLDKKWRPITPLFGTEDSYYLGMEGVESKLYLENGLNAVVRDFKNIANKKEIFDENNSQLIWGSKVSKEFRLRVLEMAKKIKVDPNWIMIIIAKETSLTFDPHIDNGIGYVGLIQFSEASAEQVGTTQSELKKMTAVTQLNYVEKRFEKLRKNGYKSLTDLYLAVLQPTSVGQGDKDDNILWTSKRMAYYNNPSYHKEKGEYDHKIVKQGKTKRGFDEGTTYMWEVREELERIEEEGQYARNTWRNPLDKMELRGWYSTWRPEDSNHGVVPTRNKGKHDGLDLYAPVGTPIFACVDGIRVGVGPNPSESYGKTITIRGFYNGKEYHFFYAHLSETYITIGEKVKAGKKIGLTGKTGNAKDLLAKQTHLHFEVRKSSASQGAGIDPLNAILELKNIVNVNPNKENQK